MSIYTSAFFTSAGVKYLTTTVPKLVYKEKNSLMIGTFMAIL
jgi:hypothetical protein